MCAHTTGLTAPSALEDLIGEKIAYSTQGRIPEDRTDLRKINDKESLGALFGSDRVVSIALALATRRLT
jgi:hypothetical protein